MAFPTDLTGFVDHVTVITAAHLNALEAKVGVDASAVVTSLDYLLKNPASIDPGHQHSLLDQLGINTGGIAPASKLQVAETITTSLRGIMSSQHNTGTDGARFHLRKSRGSLVSPAVIVSGDNLGRIVATGYDGAAYQEMASIIFGTEGTIAAGRVPTNIVFQTATNASPSVLTERMRITAAGYVGIGTNSPVGKLDVNGNIRSMGWVVPASGTGIEIGYYTNGDYGILMSYDRTAPSYKPLYLYGTNINIIPAVGYSIGVNTTSPNAAALMHLSSTTKGFLPPVMTTAQKNAISSPPAGLVVFDSTLGKLCVYSGGWQTVTSA